VTVTGQLAGVGGRVRPSDAAQFADCGETSLSLRATSLVALTRLVPSTDIDDGPVDRSAH
jgi:hypothetical protein